MHAYLIQGGCILFLCLSYFIFSSYLTARLHAQHAIELGCKLPRRAACKLPLGIDVLQRIMRADREKRVPDMFLEVYRELGGPSTWVQCFLGTDAFVTVDPKNIQAILATQFDDFAIGETRRRNFWPMLGNGIFTADGRAW
jgi:hypothetical protein